MPYVYLDEELKDFPHIDKIAKGLVLFEACHRDYYPDFLGHYGALENNLQAMQSNIAKLHIALNDKDYATKAWQYQKGVRRTSDNFLLYARHFFYPDRFMILAIVTPEAHKRIDGLISFFIDKAEQFHSINKNELNRLPCFTEKDCAEYEITMTD